MPDPVTSLPYLPVFIAAAEELSFSVAARKLAMTPAGVSRAIARLEDSLGTALFTRTTRSVRLTEEGRIFYDRCTETLANLGEAEESLRGRQSVAKGRLRVTAPSTYAHYRLMPALPKFMALHPAITIEVSITSRNLNLIDDGFDAAVRLGDLPDSRLISRKLEDAPVGFYASPAYLKSRGTPKTLEHLKSHNCLPFVRPSTGKATTWLYRSKGVDGEFTPRGPIQIEEDVLGCLRAAIGGGGICQMLEFTAKEAVARGELVPILQSLKGRTRAFSLIYRRNTHLSAKMVALSQFLSTLSN
jgi:DNA-binding transcriptional LysR family regulator